MSARVLVIVVAALLSTVALAPPGAVGASEAPLPDEPRRIPGTVVVGFHGGIPIDVVGWLTAQGGAVELVEPATRFVMARFASDAVAADAEANLLSREDVRYVEPAFTVHLDWPAEKTVIIEPDALTPNDPLYPQQWGYPAIHAPEAWDLTRASHAVKVAVLDTGVQGDHPDLAANLCGPHASFTSFADPLDDWSGHGTHVAGTIAAVTDNGVGVAGMSDACIMAVQVLNPMPWCVVPSPTHKTAPCTYGQTDNASSAGVAAGIVFAAANGARVISMSFSTAPAQVVRDALEFAYVEHDVLIVKSAGNHWCGLEALVVGHVNAGTITWPGQEDTVVAVAALNKRGPLSFLWNEPGPASFSSCGNKMELAAPGQDVVSTWRGSAYASLGGTSMAAPHVSGLAALVRASNPELTAYGTRCVLALTARDVYLPGWDTWTGWGRVDAHAAVLAASGGGFPLPEPSRPQACLLPLPDP